MSELNRGGKKRALEPTTRRPFWTIEEDVFLNLTRSQAMLARRFERLFKERRLTPATYNILRILRGAGQSGLQCSEIPPRMLSEVPDVTRLIDRLVALGLVVRYRTDEDRRRVFQTLTPKGLSLLAEMDGPMRDIHRSQLGHMSRQDLERLNQLLVQARLKVAGST